MGLRDRSNIGYCAMTLRVGIVGFGVVGKKRYACFEANPNTQVIAVADQMFADNKPDFPTNSYSNFEALVDQENIDILVVCLTNDVAADVTIKGLELGLHVFCEKPPGRNVGDICAVRKAEAAHSHLKVKYGFNHRYHDSVIEAKRLVDSQKFGKIINMRGVYGKSKLITFGQSDWRTKREIAGGGVLLDQGIHMVDLMRYFAGDFNQVHSFVSNSYWGHDVEDNAYVLMRSDEGVVAMLNSTATSWRHRFELDITMEKGGLVLAGILSGSKSYGAEKLTIIEANFEWDNGDPKETVIRYNRDQSWQREVDSFLRHIMDDTPVESGSSLDALRSMEHVYRIYSADEQWRRQFSIEIQE